MLGSVIRKPDSLKTKDRSIRLRPLCRCEQEHVILYNAILHNSAARAKNMHTHDRLYLFIIWTFGCTIRVLIGQSAMGRSLMDRSINFYLFRRRISHPRIGWNNFTWSNKKKFTGTCSEMGKYFCYCKNVLTRCFPTYA